MKERLVGAAVLVAVAVIMVPEMFSGSGSHQPESQKAPGSEASDSSESGQVKTYRIELQQREGPAASSASSVQTMPSVPDTHADAIASTVPQVTTPSPVDTPSNQDTSSSSSASRAAASVSRSSQKSVAAATATSRSSSSISHAVSPSPTVAAGGWAVQIGSFSSEATARKIVSEAKSQGFSAFHSPVKVGSNTLYRVRVGPYASREAAQTALTRLKRGYAQASLVAPNH